MRRTEAKPMTTCRRGYCRLPLAKAHRAAGSHDQGRDAGKGPAAPGQRYALFNTHSGDIQMPANVPANKQPPLSCFHACAAWRHETACFAPWNGLFRAAKRHIREAQTAPVGNSLNGSGLYGVAVWWHRNTGWQRPLPHSSATRRRPPGRHHNFWGDANQKKPKIKNFITWYRYHFCKK